MYQLNIQDKAQFLTDYWQKRPCVIRNAFNHFIDPIDQHELAGLAQEADIDSRIVHHQEQTWRVEHGPFVDFAKVCKGAWSLLVQGVDRYNENTQSLMKAFSMLPDWRLEDVMVSFSVAGAGVGPHLDQYDVFIVQGLGSRRWQVGNKGDYETVRPHPDLSQITGFTPIIDEVLYPGDMIYIPPAFPHNGVALEECLNYSIGLRAPSQQELLAHFADWCVEHNAFNSERYSDPDLATRTVAFEMKQQELSRFRQLAFQMINSQHFERFIGDFFTRSDESEDYLADIQTFSVKDVAKMIENNRLFSRSEHTKLLLLPPSTDEKNDDKSTWNLYVNQHHIAIPEKWLDEVKLLLERPEFQVPTKIYYVNSLFFTQFVSTLLNTGSYYPA